MTTSKSYDEHRNRREEGRMKYLTSFEETIISQLFDKTFTFSFNTEWSLPEGTAWFASPTWAVDELQELKSFLNKTKSQLNDLNLDEWSAHTRKRNHAGEVNWSLRSTVNPEFLTQAWTKFYESVYTYKLIPKTAVEEKQLVSLHLCEAPGAFISSLNHYLKLNHKDIEWQWRASTLNPYYEGNSPSTMISDDRFMFYTLDNWNFGIDNTGNLMDWDNSQDIIQKTRMLGKVMLVTADGSIDCLEKPDEQEAVTSPLHYCEIVTALQALSSGGNFLFKLFTMFEHSTVCLLYLINNLFEVVNIYKPVTSKQGNSEVYCICLNYKGVQVIEEFLPALKLAFGTDLYHTRSMFPMELIPNDFLYQVRSCADKFRNFQSEVIDNNLSSFLYRNTTYIDLKNIKGNVSQRFLEHYEIAAIEREDEILKGKLHEENVDTMRVIQPKFQRGSYSDRMKYKDMNPIEKIGELEMQLRDMLTHRQLFMAIEEKYVSVYQESVRLKLKIIPGAPITCVNSSKFIYAPILKLYLKIVSDGHFKMADIQSTTTHVNTVDSDNRTILHLPEYNHSGGFDEYESGCFKLLFQQLNRLQFEDDLRVVNMHLLTQFNVGVVHVIAIKYFESVVFVKGGGVIFRNFKKTRSRLIHLERVVSERDKLVRKGCSVLSILPVHVTNTGGLYECIVAYNNDYYAHKCKEHLEKLYEHFSR